MKGLLREHNINTKSFDANIDFYWWLFKEYHKNQSCNSDRKRYLVTHIEEASNTLRSVPKNLQNYRWAVNVVDEYLSEVSPAGTRIALNSFEISNKHSSNALFQFIKEEENVFRQYFNYAHDKIVETNSQVYLFPLCGIGSTGSITCVR